MKKILLTFSLLLLALLLFCQKKQLTHDVYDSWNDIRSFQISTNGEFSSYQLNPQKGDGQLHIVKIEIAADIAVFDRGGKCKFFVNSDIAAFNVIPQADTIRNLKIKKEKDENFPKDSLFVYFIKTDSLIKFPRIKSFDIAKEESNVICFLQEKEKEDIKSDSISDETEIADSLVKSKPKKNGGKLVIMNFDDSTSASIENVDEFKLSENGSFIIFKSEIKDSVTTVVVGIVDSRSLKTDTILFEEAFVKGISVDDDGLFYAFYYSQDTSEIKNWSLKVYEISKGEMNTVLPENILEINPGWKIKEDCSLRFTEDGSKLYFGTSFVLSEIKNDSIPDDEVVKLDIWSWNDSRIMPQQLNDLKEDKKKSFAAIYYIESGEARQIADSSMDKVNLKTKGQHNIVIGYTQIPYEERIQWSTETFRDYFIVNTLTGKRTKLAEDFNGSISLAPGGKFAAVYDKRDSIWYIYDVRQKKSYPLTEDIETKFYNVERELPVIPSHYGIAGWLKNDRAVVVYDKYDLWMLGCGENGEATNLTKGFGRKNEIVLRYIKTDKDVFYIDENEKILIGGFNKKSKNSSLYYFDIKTGDLQLLLDLPYRIRNIIKSKESDQYVYSKSDFNTYPDYYTVLDNNDWNNAKKISNANPQKEDYLWGTVEMYNWIDFNGDTVSGLLYKPEDFNPDGKYPMIVYFYERYSDYIHAHYTPKPSRSVISFPLFLSKGYVIFIPDIHYGTGQPGKDAYNSIVSGTYSLIEKEFVNKDKIGIQGQSWGGYQVAFLVTQTNLFACAMSGAPVSNMTSAYGGIRKGSGNSRMMQYEEGQSRIGGTLWEDLPAYIENSPIFFADKIETPLLIMHNDGDGAVPFSQGVELFLAMKRLGKPAWLLNYNGEQHNLRDRPNCVDLSHRMTDFFDYYLKDEGNPRWIKDGVPAVYKGTR
jgi:dipeptidyl aminopeptidase/acylaminoacyl peptidase